jgi:hypothetical protein
MEDFLNEIRAYAKAHNIKPDSVPQKAAALSGLTWGKWVAGKSYPRWDTMQKIRAYIKADPASHPDEAA